MMNKDRRSGAPAIDEAELERAVILSEMVAEIERLVTEADRLDLGIVANHLSMASELVKEKLKSPRTTRKAS
jgi:hypothetical protein